METEKQKNLPESITKVTLDTKVTKDTIVTKDSKNDCNNCNNFIKNPQFKTITAEEERLLRKIKSAKRNIADAEFI